MTTRLPGARYKFVFDRGRSFKGRLLVAWRLGTRTDAPPQAGVVVSKRSFHDAVDRNRAKRLMREAFRLLAKDGFFEAGEEWVLVARSQIGGKMCEDVMKELKWIKGKMASLDREAGRSGIARV